MSNEKEDPAYQRIKEKLLRIGVAIPGTIRETYLLCGRGWCACAKGGESHGPYYFWNRKVNGKLTSKSIPKDKLHLYRDWISNRFELEALLTQLLDLGQKYAANLTEKMPENNYKKRASAKRGK